MNAWFLVSSGDKDSFFFCSILFVLKVFGARGSVEA